MEACWPVSHWQRCTLWLNEVTISNISSTNSNNSNNNNSRFIINSNNKLPGFTCPGSAFHCLRSLKGRLHPLEVENIVLPLLSPPSEAIRMASTRYCRGRRPRILRRLCPPHMPRSSRRRTPNTWPRRGTACTRDSPHRRVSIFPYFPQS